MVCFRPSSHDARGLNHLSPVKPVSSSCYMLVLGFTCKLSLRRRGQFPLMPEIDGNLSPPLTLNGRSTLDGGRGDGRLSCMSRPGC